VQIQERWGVYSRPCPHYFLVVSLDNPLICHRTKEDDQEDSFHYHPFVIHHEYQQQQQQQRQEG
jgi:hypothetical protein